MRSQRIVRAWPFGEGAVAGLSPFVPTAAIAQTYRREAAFIRGVFTVDGVSRA
jgi:hypothetical protein